MARDKRYQIFSSPEGDLSIVGMYVMDYDSNNAIDTPIISPDVAYFDAGTLMIKTEEFFNLYQDCAFVYCDDNVSYIDDLHRFPSFPLGTKGKMYNASFLIDLYNIPVSSSAPSSLNGNGCEFKDNTIVNVVGRDIQYTVLSSMYYLLEDNSYTVLYALQSPTGETLNCPESFCTRYVPPVTAT